MRDICGEGIPFANGVVEGGDLLGGSQQDVPCRAVSLQPETIRERGRGKRLFRLGEALFGGVDG